jgi:hypothetical protein
VGAKGLEIQLPTIVYEGPVPDEKMLPTARHYELVLDVGEAMAVASAIHRGSLVGLVEHLCIDHVANQLGKSRSFRLAAVVGVDQCRRPCSRCEQLAARRRTRAFAS